MCAYRPIYRFRHRSLLLILLTMAGRHLSSQHQSSSSSAAVAVTSRLRPLLPHPALCIAFPPSSYSSSMSHCSSSHVMYGTRAFLLHTSTHHSVAAHIVAAPLFILALCVYCIGFSVCCVCGGPPLLLLSLPRSVVPLHIDVTTQLSSLSLSCLQNPPPPLPFQTRLWRRRLHTACTRRERERLNV